MLSSDPVPEESIKESDDYVSRLLLKDGEYEYYTKHSSDSVKLLEVL